MSFFGDPYVVLTKFGEITIDVTLNEDHEYDTFVTDNPIEDGTIFSDHVILLPTVLNITGRVTDAAITILGIPKLSKSIDAFRELVALQTNKTPFSVSTALHFYENMYMKNIQFLRTSNDGQSIRFSAVLREIQIVGSNTDTNRERIARDVQHTALSSLDRGFVNKVIL